MNTIHTYKMPSDQLSGTTVNKSGVPFFLPRAFWDHFTSWNAYLCNMQQYKDDRCRLVDQCFSLVSQAFAASWEEEKRCRVVLRRGAGRSTVDECMSLTSAKVRSSSSYGKTNAFLAPNDRS